MGLLPLSMVCKTLSVLAISSSSLQTLPKLLRHIPFYHLSTAVPLALYLWQKYPLIPFAVSTTSLPLISTNTIARTSIMLLQKQRSSVEPHYRHMSCSDLAMATTASLIPSTHIYHRGRRVSNRRINSSASCSILKTRVRYLVIDPPFQDLLARTATKSELSRPIRLSICTCSLHER